MEKQNSGTTNSPAVAEKQNPKRFGWFLQVLDFY